MRRTVPILALLAAVSGAAGAQPLCLPTDTLVTCEERVATAVRSDDAPAAAIRPRTDADGKSTEAADTEGTQALATALLRTQLGSKLPPEIASLPGAAGSLDDFLSKLRLSVSTTPVEGSEKAAIAVELGQFLGLPADDGYKLQALFRPAQLASGLSSQLSGEAVDEANKDLGDFDDALFTFSYAPATQRLGRELKAHEDLTSALFSEAVQSLDEAREREADRLEAEQTAIVNQLDPRHLRDGDFVDPLNVLPPDVAGQLMAVTEAKELARWATQQELSRALRSQGYFHLADLVANQPQLVVSVSRTVRDPLVGAEEVKGKIAYEMGFTNVNGLRRWAADGNCSAIDLACLAAFMDAKRRRQLAATAGNRLAFSVEYSGVEKERITLGSASLDVEGFDHWNGSLAYGRNLRVDTRGAVLLRTDLTGSYEDWSDDPKKQDRTLLKLSFTQRISDEFSAVVGAVWASKPELRGEVDEELSARAGITYSLDRKTE